MGAIYNTLFQNKRRMVEIGLCTDSQYEYDVIKLVDCMDTVIEQLDGRKNVIFVSDNNALENKWDNDKESVFQYPSDKKTAKELDEFHQFTQGRYLPKMKAIKTIGMYESNGHTKVVHNYFIGSVVNQGADLPLFKIIQIT